MRDFPFLPKLQRQTFLSLIAGGKVHPGSVYTMWVCRRLGEKNMSFEWKHFSSINFVGLHLLSSNLWTVKWDLREGYGGSNLGEKMF